MKTIHKFEVRIHDMQDIEMPERAAILAVQVQNDKIFLWAEVDTSRLKIKRTILVRGTGHELGIAENAIHIGTVQAPPFVWHIYDGGQAD
jgi:hypothetical protein